VKDIVQGCISMHRTNCYYYA